MLPIRVILHPTDFSVQAKHSFSMARLIARECGARLIALHVVGLELNLPERVQTDMGLAFDCSQDCRGHQAALLKLLHEQFEADADLPVETRLVYGDAATEILRIAEEVPCDLIVMGTHGRSGLGRLLTGSVAEAVLRRATCPVLTVKLPLVEVSAAPGVAAGNVVTRGRGALRDRARQTEVEPIRAKEILR
jgi:nucleotide-binding universal stress UspA family protein